MNGHRLFKILCCVGLLLASFMLTSLKIPKFKPPKIKPSKFKPTKILPNVVPSAPRGYRKDKDDDDTFWKIFFGGIAVVVVYTYFKDKNKEGDNDE